MWDSSTDPNSHTATTTEHHAESTHFTQFSKPLSPLPQVNPFDNPTPISTFMKSEASPGSLDALMAETPLSFISSFDDEPIDLDIFRTFGDVPNNGLDIFGNFLAPIDPQYPPDTENPFPTPSPSTNPSPLLSQAPLPTSHPPPPPPLPQSPPSSVGAVSPAEPRSQAPGRSFHCDHLGCNKSYPRACDLKKHKKRHQKPFPCRYGQHEGCDSTFSTTKERDRHERSKHRREEHLVCSVCGHKTARKDNMADHVKRRHGQENKERVMATILGLR